jgi:DNA-binding transcriptional MerR regulator/uncharacterized protein (DUF433 family)
VIEPSRGVYDAPRAAALAGVPESTLHYWARKGIYRPSISPEPRVWRWSWSDLLTLRVIDWLRRDKGIDDPPRVSIHRIRQALDELGLRGKPAERLHEVIVVSQGGHLFLDFPDEGTVRAVRGQQGAFRDMLRLVRPYRRGPDLLTPRPLLRIIPGKLHGEPHLLSTRIPAAAVYSLLQSGYTLEQIRSFYSEASPEAVAEAIDLDQSLEPRLRAA